MSVSEQATALMVKIVYQLRPPATTTMAPCFRCSSPSPGGQVCASCLDDDLGGLINNRGAAMRWLNSVKQAARDEQTVLSYARKTETDSRLKSR
jgi:hypothetical protein